MYQPNLPQPTTDRLKSCGVDCFDDLCDDCKVYNKSSDDESSFDQSTTVNQFIRRRSASSYSTDGYSPDDEASDDERFGSIVELNRLSQQVSERAQSLEAHFQWFNKALGRLDSRELQLQRQNGHCLDLQGDFEEFLESLREQIGSIVNFDEWFMQLNVLEAMLDDFDDDTEEHLERLNDHMERLYDLFDRENAQLANAPGTLENLERHSIEQRFVSEQIARAELQLNRLGDHLEEQVQEQRQIIAEFVGMMDSIVQGVQSALASDEVASEFDCFAGLRFLQDFNKTLNQIQIIWSPSISLLLSPCT